MSQVSSACCSLPPVVAKGYQEKGRYSEIAGLKTYVTGPSDAKTAILMVGDIFGFSPQVLQGADILAYSNPQKKYLVFHPDFFDGKPAQPSWFAPNSEDGPAKIGEFFKTLASPPAALGRIPAFVEEVNKTTGVSAWVTLGLCWGGKVVSLAAGGAVPNKFIAGAQVHPAMLDPADALKIKIPFATLASGDEDKEHVKSFGENLTGEKVVYTFSNQGHGWMAARADLENEEVRKGYQQGYKMISDFFGRHV